MVEIMNSIPAYKKYFFQKAQHRILTVVRRKLFLTLEHHITANNMASGDLRKAMEATARDFFDSYQAGTVQNDPSLVNRSVSPDCKRHLLPKSMLKAAGIPVEFAFDNETYQNEFTKDLKLGSVGEHDVANLVIDVEARKLAATTTTQIHYKVGEKERLTLEFSWFFNFNEDGSKITKVVEFTDSNAVQKMLDIAAAAKKEVE